MIPGSHMYPRQAPVVPVERVRPVTPHAVVAPVATIELEPPRLREPGTIPVPASIYAIKARIAAEHGVTIAEIDGRSRRRRIVIARWAAIRAVQEERPGYSFPQIGRAFGRDHSTIMHALGLIPRRGASRADLDRAALRAAVLDQWCAGLPTIRIAESHGITVGAVSNIVTAARTAEDPRAIRRRSSPQFRLAANRAAR